MRTQFHTRLPAVSSHMGAYPAIGSCRAAAPCRRPSASRRMVGRLRASVLSGPRSGAAAVAAWGPGSGGGSCGSTSSGGAWLRRVDLERRRPCARRERRPCRASSLPKQRWRRRPHGASSLPEGEASGGRNSGAPAREPAKKEERKVRGVGAESIWSRGR
jgi:hypothetical protein